MTPSITTSNYKSGPFASIHPSTSSNTNPSNTHTTLERLLYSNLGPFVLAVGPKILRRQLQVKYNYINVQINK